MKLSNRMIAITNFIPQNSIVADIGTDHGFIPMFLIDNKISKKVIATDISQGSLDKTIGYIEEFKYEGLIEARLGNGLEVIKPFEVDTVVIAGMGGLLIRDILEKDIDLTHSFNNFIFQPMVASSDLREYLLKNGFMIIDEDLIKEDGKFYEVIFAKRGKAIVEEGIYLEIGKKLIKKRHPLLKEFLQDKIDMLRNILKSLEDKDSEKIKIRCEELEKNISEYQGVLNTIEG